MKIPDYNVEKRKSDFKPVKDHEHMPDDYFRMLICGPSGSGKTNLLIHMIRRLLYFNKVFLYSKNLDQNKYQDLIETFESISEGADYPVLEASNDAIIPVSKMNNKPQKIVIFDDFVCGKNQQPLIEYFLEGRHKKCSVIYLSQSYFRTPKDIRSNCRNTALFCYFINRFHHFCSTLWNLYIWPKLVCTHWNLHLGQSCLHSLES